MRGRRGEELGKLEQGLANARELHDLIGQLQSRPPARLFESARYYSQWTGFHMSIAGIYFLALKERVGHGNFKKYLAERRFRYFFAWECMKAAHVVSRHELFGKLRSSRAFRSLIALPEPEQDALVKELKDIPSDRLGDLLPTLIQKRYDEIRQEEQKARPKKRLTEEEEKRLQEINERYQRDKLDTAWMEINRLWAVAVGAIGRLADAAEKIEMQERHYDEVFKRDMLAPISREFDRLVHKWRPIEEIQKRSPVMERPSFAARR